MIKDELKDWQIAQMMFGKNTKTECSLVKMLRVHGEIERIENENDWSIIKDKRNDDCGWLIPTDCLK